MFLAFGFDFEARRIFKGRTEREGRAEPRVWLEKRKDEEVKHFARAELDYRSKQEQLKREDDEARRGAIEC